MQRFFVEPEDMAACRALLRGGSRSFFAAALLLPGRIAEPATALYAFCRVADDAIDLGDDPEAALAALNARLDGVYAGEPADDPVDRAFAATVAAYGIPRALPEALIEGLAWDAAGRRYASLPALLDYAARVAGSVGVMMAMIMGVRSPAGLARAADLGVAMQLTNIARDVGEDARAGRLFLPLDWLAAAGVEPAAFLQDPAFSRPLGGVVARLLAEAAGLYRRAAGGIAWLPLGCRPGIAAACHIYAAIGAEVARAEFDSVTRRARVTGVKKVLLAGRALLDTLRPRGEAISALPAVLFLLNAAPADPPAPSMAAKVLMLFERLERMQRAEFCGAPGKGPEVPTSA